MHKHECQKICAIQMPKMRKSGHSYTFFKMAALKTGAIRHVHAYYVIYREFPHPEVYMYVKRRFTLIR